MDSSRKEEILAKSRNANNDEGMEHAKMRGFKLGDKIATWTVGIPLMVFSACVGQYNVAWALASYMMAFEFGAALTAYRFTKKKPYLALVIGTAILAMFAALRFIANVLGWR